MQRITITVDDQLTEEFEKFREERGYANRSEAVRDLIRERLDAQRLEKSPSGDCLATLIYVYNHHERELAARMTKAHHAHQGFFAQTVKNLH